MLDRKYEDELRRHHLKFEFLLLKTTENLIESLAAANKSLIPGIKKLLSEFTQASPVLSSKKKFFFVDECNLYRATCLNNLSVLNQVFHTQDKEIQIQAIVDLNPGLNKVKLSAFMKEHSPNMLKLAILSSPQLKRILMGNDKEERMDKLFNELSTPDSNGYTIYYDLIMEDLIMRKNSPSKGPG